MFKTTTSALAICALLAVGAVAQTTDQATDATEQTDDAMMKAGDAADAAATNAEAAAENAGEAVENAAEAVGNAGEAAVENAGDAAAEAGDAAAEAGDALTDAAGEAVQETGEAMENAGEAMENAGDEMRAEEVETTTTTEGDTTVTTTEGAAPAEVEAPAEGEVVTETAEPAEPAEGTPVEGQIFEQSADSFLASTLLGATVQTPDGENVGDVEDMIIKADGSLEGVVIGVGGFLGLGEKEVAVEFSAIQIQQDAESGDLTFVLSSTEEELEAAPEFRTQDDMRAEAAANEPVVTDGGLADPNAAPADPNAAPADTTTAN